MLASAAAPTLDALASAIEMRASRPDPAWLSSWRAADELVPAALADAPEDFEPKLLARVEPELPDDAVVWLSSSMPVRDVEAWFRSRPSGSASWPTVAPTGSTA